MKNLPEPTRAVDSLPSFLDSHADDETTVASATEAEHDDAAPADADGGADEHAHASDEDAGEATEDANDAHAESGDATPAADAAGTADARRANGRGRRRRDEPAPSAPSRTNGTLAIVLGVLALLGVPAAALLPVFASYGATPNLMFVLGALLVAAGMTQRHVGRLQQRLDDGEQLRRDDAAALQQQLQQLVDGHQRDRAPAQGEELQHVLMSLQRQDEKINNLTKAIKMYGKPLMEIANQGTELASSVTAVKALVEGGSESTRQAVVRVEGQVRQIAGAKDAAETLAAVRQLAPRIDALASKPTATVSLEPLQQQFGRVEVAIAAVAQRLEDNEVRKSLLRLEEATQKSRDAVAELLRGEPLREATKQLQSRVDSATKGLTDGLQQLRDGNLGGLETAVREIQREIAGVATAVAQLNVAVKNSARAPSAPPAAPAAAPAATQATAAPAAPAPSAAPAAAPAAAAPAASDAAGGNGYATGTRSSGGKNVLGAIAKLKQMKG